MLTFWPAAEILYPSGRNREFPGGGIRVRGGGIGQKVNLFLLRKHSQKCRNAFSKCTELFFTTKQILSFLHVLSLSFAWFRLWYLSPKLPEVPNPHSPCRYHESSAHVVSPTPEVQHTWRHLHRKFSTCGVAYTESSAHIVSSTPKAQHT